MAIQKVGVVGCGLMGAGIAQVCAQAGLTTVVREVSSDLLDKGLKGIEKNLARLVQKGTISETMKGEVRERLQGTTSLQDLKGCDLVVEAIIEKLPAKRELFAELDALCPAQTIFASNTSSLAIIEIATSTKRPQRFVGLHFFNPVPVMKLVEVVRTIATDAAVYDEMVAFGAKLGKTPVRANDSCGFIVNRLLVPYLLDAVRALEEGAGFDRGHRQFHEAWAAVTRWARSRCWILWGWIPPTTYRRSCSTSSRKSGLRRHHF